MHKRSLLKFLNLIFLKNEGKTYILFFRGKKLIFEGKHIDIVIVLIFNKNELVKFLKLAKQLFFNEEGNVKYKRIL